MARVQTAILLVAGVLLTTAAIFWITLGVKNVKKYEWLPTESAPTNAPIRILSGGINLADGAKMLFQEDTYINNGWGNISAVAVVGPALKALPQSFDVTWLSLSEGQFYQGQFDLPQDILSQRFSEGTLSPPPMRQIPWDKLVFGFAPGGGISIWTNAEGISKELAAFQAVPTDIDWADFNPRPELNKSEFLERYLKNRLSKSELETFLTDGPHTTFFGDSRKRYDWSLRLKGGQIKGFWTNYANGEREFRNPENIGFGRISRSSPVSLQVTWAKINGTEMLSEIQFDLVETIQAMDALTELDGNDSVEIVLEYGLVVGHMDVTIENSESIVPLEKAVVEVFLK